MYRKALSKAKYHELCLLVDERDSWDGYPCCVICGKPVGTHGDHHHIIFRSSCGGDELDNMVLLCHDCHMTKAHGVEEKKWREWLMEYIGERR